MRVPRRLARPLLVLVVALFTATPAPADVLDGTYTLNFTGAQSLWPLDDLEVCESAVAQGFSIDACINMTFVQDGAGGVSGSGSLDLTIVGQGLTVQATFVGGIRGKSKGSDTRGVTHTTSFKFSGVVTAQGRQFPSSTGGKLITQISPAGLASTTGSLKLAVKGAGSVKGPLEPPVVEQLPSGDWSAILTVTPDARGTRLRGSIDLMLPGGALQIPLSGKYVSRRDTSSIKAKGGKGDRAARGVSLSMKTATSTGPGNIGGEAAVSVRGLRFRADVGP